MSSAHCSLTFRPPIYSKHPSSSPSLSCRFLDPQQLLNLSSTIPCPCHMMRLKRSSFCPRTTTTASCFLAPILYPIMIDMTTEAKPNEETICWLSMWVLKSWASVWNAGLPSDNSTGLGLSYVTFLCFSFLICKMGMTKVLIL